MTCTMKGLCSALAGVLLAMGLSARAERSVTMFVAVTGAPTTADVERKLDALAAAGVDSFMFYPTSGMRMEYLGAEFFRCARDFAVGAAKRGMKMWLYDEYNWPSGSCRGRVPSENERWRYSEVSFHRDATGGVRRVVSYGPQGWVTLLEPDGVRRFLELTYDAYARELGPWIKDGTIPGIFTDEPGHHVKVDLPPKPICSCRWWSTLPDGYRAAAGRAFDADAAANALDWTAYARLLGRRFRSSYYDQARAAADRLGLRFCGHLISDNSPYEALLRNGDPLLALRGESFPGIDEIWSEVEPEKIPFFLYALADHAIARNGKGGMAELFACGPADMSPEHLRRMINLCALHGVTRYFTVMSAMDLGWMEQMRGFTTVVGEYQPWFASFRTVLDEADAASAFARKRFVRDAAVRYPQDAIARMLWLKGPRPPVGELLREIELSGFTPDLVAAEEKSSLPVVFAFDGADIVDERTGRRFADASAAVAYLASVRPVAGRRRNVILRRAEDGTRRELDLNPMPRPVADKGGLSLDWRVTLDAPNQHRVTFDTNGVGRIRLAAPLKGLRLAVRRHVPDPALEDSKLIAYGSMCEGKGEKPPPYRITLDGRTVVADCPCDVLRPGLDSLYGQTEALDLTAGEHEFRIVSGRMDDNYFLPVAVLTGAFVTRDGSLAPLPEKLPTGSLAAAGLKGFAGTASYEATVDLPMGAELEISSGNAFTQVLVDGADLGTRAWAPFVWRVPADRAGKDRRLTVRVATSLLPLFGDPKAPGTKWKRDFHKPPLSGESDPGLLSVRISSGAQGALAVPARKVLNVVNFVRALDPRMPKAEYVRALDEEVKLNRKYGFPNTVLLQYDALVDAEMLATARKSDPAKTEFGFWFEMSRPLNEAAGLPWKPTAKHKDWNWDWFINPGFLMAYDHDGRRRLVDAAFAKFRELFGHYPKSVGSWLLDAYSMGYMVEKYGVDGFCICREQDNTDAYGLRGGYSNGAYYPSKRNMLSAAVDMKNAVRSPVFKMLTPDPIHNYGNPDRLYSDYPYRTGCATLEPVWNTGFEPRIVDWFFRVYTEPKGLVNLSYMQAGQENSFGWRNISKGWPMQCAKIAAEAAAGRLVVETMGETARRFKADHPANCPQTQVALEDWNGNRRKSIWYNSRFYRANLILDGGRLVFRDIHKMADDFEEPFLDKVCTGWQALYFTPPVVDQWLFRDKGVSGTLAFDGVFASLAAEPTPAGGLVVTAVRPTGERVTVRFDEGRIAVKGTGLSAEYVRAFREKMSIGANALGFDFSGYRYRVPVTGELTATERGYRLTGDEIVLDLAGTCL